MKGTFAALAGGVVAALGIAAAWELKRGIKTEKLRRAVAGAKDTAQAVTEIDINTPAASSLLPCRELAASWPIASWITAPTVINLICFPGSLSAETSITPSSAGSTSMAAMMP